MNNVLVSLLLLMLLPSCQAALADAKAEEAALQEQQHGVSSPSKDQAGRQGSKLTRSSGSLNNNSSSGGAGSKGQQQRSSKGSFKARVSHDVLGEWCRSFVGWAEHTWKGPAALRPAGGCSCMHTH